MRQDVLSLIPVELQTTNFEYHDDTFNKSVNEAASFLSAAVQVIVVPPPSGTQATMADDI